MVQMFGKRIEICLVNLTPKKKLFFSLLTNVFDLFRLSFSLEANLWFYRIGQVVWGFLYRNVFLFSQERLI